MLKKTFYGIFLFIIGLVAIYVFFIYSPFYSIDKFGVQYNEFREQNNIPLLPSDWIIDTIGQYGISNFHSSNMNKMGHRIKYINTRKGKVGAESDRFYLTHDSIILSRYQRNKGAKLLYLRIWPSTEVDKLINHNEANELLKKYNIDFKFDKSWSVYAE